MSEYLKSTLLKVSIHLCVKIKSARVDESWPKIHRSKESVDVSVIFFKSQTNGESWLWLDLPIGKEKLVLCILNGIRLKKGGRERK